MPPGRGRLEVRASVPEEYHRYLQKEAAYRKITVPTLVLSAIDRYLHPEQQERSALRDQLDAVTKQIGTLTPQVARVSELSTRSLALAEDVARWRGDVRSLTDAHRELLAHQQALLTHQQVLARRLSLGFSIVLGMLLLLGALVVRLWF